MSSSFFPMGQLFALSRDPIVCCRDNQIVFMNMPAIALFGSDCTGQPIQNILPESLLLMQTASYLASANINGKNVTVSSCTYEGIQLYSFVLPRRQQEQPANRAITTSLRDLTNTIKVTSDHVLSLAAVYEDEKLNRYTAILRHTSAKLKRLMLNYNTLIACQDGSQSFAPMVVSVGDLCRELLDAVSDLAYDRGIAVDFTAETEILAAVDVQLFQQMILNLLTNSLQNTAEGGTIHVTLKHSDRFLSILISDSGSGINAARNSDPFHQYEAPVQPNTGRFSAGLGIGVADSIAKMHGGSLILQTQEGKGTTVAVQIQCLPGQNLQAPKVRDFGNLEDLVLTALSPWLDWKAYNHIESL